MIPYAALIAVVSPAVLGILLYLFQNYTKGKAGWIATAAAGFSSLLILSMAKPVLDRYNEGGSSITYVYPWISPINIEFGFLIDMVSLPIGLIIAIISTLSCLYSIKYMSDEENQPFYYTNLLLFMTGMIGVIFSINLIEFYLFWELMLIPSYLLIAQWGTSRRRLSIGFKYFIFTHTGALLMLLGILSIFSYTTVSYTHLTLPTKA